MLDIKICYLGHVKAGKTSIIKNIFENMRPIDTKSIEPTQRVQVQEYKSGFIHITNTEFSGQFQDFEDLQNHEIDLIKEQDVFIYVHDAKNKDPTSSLKQFQKQFQKIYQLNKTALIYVFFHQSDMDYLYLGSRIKEQKQIFYGQFKKYIQNNYQNPTAILTRYTDKQTTIYDFSIKKAMSEVISNQVQQKKPHLNKFVTEVSKASGISNLLIWDIQSQTYICKDDIPLEEQRFYMLIDFLEMYNKFVYFYQEKRQKGKKKIKDIDSESQIIVSEKETLYIKQVDQYYCYMALINQNFIENKTFLDYNLEQLKKFIEKVIELDAQLITKY